MSTELVQLNINKSPGKSVQPALFFRQLAEKRINLPFLCLTGTDRETIVSCCIAAEDFNCVKKLIDSDPVMKQNFDIIAPVGSLTIFPHKHNLKLLGLVMNLFKKVGLPVYGIGTSISALTLNTDYRLLDMAVEKLEEEFSVPLNHAPFCQEFRVKQI